MFCLAFASCLEKETAQKEEFVYKLEDFEYYTNKFKKEIKVEKIKDSDDDIAKAYKLFVDTYGEEITEDEKPYQAFFDAESEWDNRSKNHTKDVFLLSSYFSLTFVQLEQFFYYVFSAFNNPSFALRTPPPFTQGRQFKWQIL